jgi:hypothetical protein
MTPVLEIIFAIGLIIGFAFGSSAHLFHIGGTKPREDGVHSNRGAKEI